MRSVWENAEGEGVKGGRQSWLHKEKFEDSCRAVHIHVYVYIADIVLSDKQHLSAASQMIRVNSENWLKYRNLVCIYFDHRKLRFFFSFFLSCSHSEDFYINERSPILDNITIFMNIPMIILLYICMIKYLRLILD